MKNILSRLAILSVLFLLTACGDPTKQDILNDAKGADTKSALEKALGKPDTLSTLGPIEKWVYTAKDGEVTFIITGETVAIESAN